jgi:alkylation response protein AidB-like acyl-CoA dehydrogenase
VDFTFDEDQEEIRALARRIIADHSAPARLSEIEADRGGTDLELYRALAAAGLLGLPISEDVGGAGLGFTDICLVIEEVGRHAAAAPVLESVVLGGLAIDTFGTDALRREWLVPMIAGERVLTAALTEATADPRRPEAAATLAGDGSWRLSGTKICVPAGLTADAILVPARVGGSSDGSGATGGETGVFVVPAAAGGLRRERQQTTTGRPVAMLTLDGVAVPHEARLGCDDGRAGEVLGWLVERATTALCVLAVGACEEAMRLTAAYVKERQQFGRALAAFQAVGQRAADAYVDTVAIRLTAWQAAWRLSAGLAATDQVAIAKFWACEGGQRVVHATQHLHGGVGVDRTYPVHRYFLLAKQIELDLGAASEQLALIGHRLAEATVA